MSIRNACFTSYFFQNKTFEDNLKTKKYECVMYCTFQEEICPKTHKEHTQGYIEFNTKVTLKFIKELFDDNGTHIEKRHGTREQARNYCQKTESRKPNTTFLEYGNWKWQKPGERNDINKVTEMIKEGKELKEIVENCTNTYIRNYRGIERTMNILQKPLTHQKIEKKTIIVNYGNSGTGKTKNIYINHPIEQIYRKPPGKWWDGYIGQKYILIDDVQPNEYQLEEFLQWLDEYPISVPFKGGFSPLIATHIYLTSNFHPIEWFKFKKEESKIALLRRITKINEYTFDDWLILKEIIEPFIWDEEIILNPCLNCKKLIPKKTTGYLCNECTEYQKNKPITWEPSMG